MAVLETVSLDSTVTALRSNDCDLLERYIASAKQEAVERQAMVAPRAKSFFGANGWMLIRIISYNYYSSTRASAWCLATTICAVRAERLGCSLAVALPVVKLPERAAVAVRSARSCRRALLRLLIALLCIRLPPAGRPPDQPLFAVSGICVGTFIRSSGNRSPGERGERVRNRWTEGTFDGWRRLATRPSIKFPTAAADLRLGAAVRRSSALGGQKGSTRSWRIQSEISQTSAPRPNVVIILPLLLQLWRQSAALRVVHSGQPRFRLASKQPGRPNTALNAWQVFAARHSCTQTLR